MNFIKKIFSRIGVAPKKDTNCKTGTNLLQINDYTIEKKYKTYNFETFETHEDIVNLLWLSDGIKKNYETGNNKTTFKYKYENITLEFLTFSPEEPSLISLKLPIEFNNNLTNVKSPPYYPTYASLNNEQRGVYWEFLKNPYDARFNIGYIFILYYGLERHLLEGDIDSAFSVILKLRDVHSNSSFQNYSANALILICLLRKRSDLIVKFYNSIDKDYENNFSDNLNLLCKIGLNIPLTHLDIMRMHKTFEFPKTNYIKKYPELFLEKLQSVMKGKIGTSEIYIDGYVSPKDWNKLHKEEMRVFANVSLNATKIDVPLVCENFKLKKTIFDLLDETHEYLKKDLSMMRKEGILPIEIKTSNDKVINNLIFDESIELEYLRKCKQLESNPINLHFLLNDFHKFYYKYRELSDEYLDKCIDICLKDIKLLPKLQEHHIKEENKYILQYSNIHSKKEVDKQLSQIEYFQGTIPAFKRLAIIYEKRKDFQSAIDICNCAIEYYTTYNLKSMAIEISEFNERINKLTKKLERQSN